MRKVGLLLAAVVSAATIVAVVPSTANGATLLCSGVSKADVAKCDPGWAANMHKMHWRMFAGHNCTNYVAYRLSKDGIPMPPYRLGNADTWAPNAKRNGVRVDSQPAVGSVGAWPGRRHIVYVDEVGPGYLIISEDNWPGFYPRGMYRKLKVFKGERGYPTQFIHFKGGNPGNSGTINGPLPKVEGTPEVGSTLTATAGTWTPSGVTLKYQWLRDGATIGGATSRTYTLTDDDVGSMITVSVTGSKSGLTARTTSSTPIGPVTGDEETTSDTPTISGPPQVGGTLTADPGTWEPNGVTFGYQWLANGSAISGATQKTFVVTKAQLGKRLSVRVTGRADGNDPISVESARTEVVTPKAIAAGTPTISGDARTGEWLTADPGEWGPRGVALGYQWFRGDQPISAATSTRYQVSTADLGQRLTFTVTATKKGYPTVQKSSEPTTEALATPTLDTVANPGKRGWAVVEVVVTAPENPVPTGSATVSEGEKDLKTLDLAIGRDGRATLRIRLPKGTHSLTVSYSGSSTVAPGSETVSVKVF